MHIMNHLPKGKKVNLPFQVNRIIFRSMLKNFVLVLFCCCFSLYAFAQISFEKNVVTVRSNFVSFTAQPIAVDLNGDQLLDLVAWEVTGGELIVKTQLPDGTFSDVKIIVDDANCNFQFAVFDVGGDGDPDIIGWEGENLLWYENLDGQGTFGEQIILFEHRLPLIPQVGDIDFDGDEDIIFKLSSNGDCWIITYENTIEGWVMHCQDFLNIDNEFKLADLDGDGDLDLVGNHFANPTIQWHENIDGVFQQTRTLYDAEDATEFFIPVSILDFNFDGRPDVLAEVKDEIVFLQNVDGSSLMEVAPTLSEELTINISFDDIDGDGDLDLISLDLFARKIYLFENLGNAYADPIEFDSRALPAFLDLDRDGLKDMLIGFMPYLSEGGFGNYMEDVPLVETEANLDSPQTVEDVDQNGLLDLFYTVDNNTQLVWYEYVPGEMSLIFRQNLELEFNEGSLAAPFIDLLDLDADGFFDLIFYTWDRGIYWMKNQGGDFAVAESLFPFDEDLRGRVLGRDLDGDGDLDFIPLNNDDRFWIENDGQQNFTESNHQVRSVENIVDFDQDGKLDITYSRDDRIFIHFQDEKGFSNSIFFSTGDHYIDWYVFGDADGDGDLDIYFVDTTGDLFWVENVDNSFPTMHEIYRELGYQRISVIDIDQDFDLDIMIFKGNKIGDPPDLSMSLFENISGRGDYSNLQILDDSYITSEPKFLDLDKDGSLDVLTFNNARVYLNFQGNNENNKIFGTVTIDSNNDSCATSPLVFIPNAPINIQGEDEEIFTFTNALGSYLTLFDSEGEFVTSVNNEVAFFFDALPMQDTIIFDSLGHSHNASFCLTPNTDINDLSVSIFPTSLEYRPGFECEFTIAYSNPGSTVDREGQVCLGFDPEKMTLLESSEAFTVVNDTIKIDFDSLKIFESRLIDFRFLLSQPPINNNGDFICLGASIVSALDDVNINDNRHVLKQGLIGSYDPNDITVLEGDSILIEQADDFLHYVIRFQNTGTASAINVRVEDFLNDMFDLNTFQVLESSHDYRVQINDGSLVNFIFDNIHLPDSTSNEPLSHGRIVYRVKPYGRAAIGDIFNNQASIFFDFNEPVITNAVSTEIYEPPVSTADLNQPPPLFKVQPNPFQDQIIILGEEEIESLSIYNGQGKLMLYQKASNIINTSAFANGMYIVKVRTKAGEEQSIKVVKSER